MAACGSLEPWLDEEGQLFEFSGQAPAPSKDFNQVIVSPTQVTFRWWKISHRQTDVARIHPGEIKQSHQDFLNDDRTQLQMEGCFGTHFLDYVTNLCKGQIDYIERIPAKCLKKIITFVDLHDIGHLSQLNKHFHRLCDDEGLWRGKFHEAGIVSDELAALAREQGWKTLYFSDKLKIQLQLSRNRKRGAVVSAPSSGKRQSAKLN